MCLGTGISSVAKDILILLIIINNETNINILTALVISDARPSFIKFESVMMQYYKYINSKLCRYFLTCFNILNQWFVNWFCVFVT